MLTRSIAKAKQKLPNTVNLIESLDAFKNLDQFDAAINFAGEPIIDKRWNQKQRKRLIDSRHKITETLVDMFAASQNPPAVFLSGSAIGVYGNRGKSVLTESSTVEALDFPSNLCLDWENIAVKAEPFTRVVLLRTGIVLSPAGGAFTKMLTPFKFGLGGRIGYGNQYWSWIHNHDYTQAVNFLLINSQISGAVNLTAPRPVTNGVFTKRLASQLRRPALFPVPEKVLKLLLGEPSCLLLDSQRVLPTKLLDKGFRFKYPTLKKALRNLLNSKV